MVTVVCALPRLRTIKEMKTRTAKVSSHISVGKAVLTDKEGLCVEVCTASNPKHFDAHWIDARTGHRKRIEFH